MSSEPIISDYRPRRFYSQEALEISDSKRYEEEEASLHNTARAKQLRTAALVTSWVSVIFALVSGLVAIAWKTRLEQTCKERTSYNYIAQTCKDRTSYNYIAQTCKERTSYNYIAQTCKERTSYNYIAQTCKERTSYNNYIAQTCKEIGVLTYEDMKKSAENRG